LILSQSSRLWNKLVAQADDPELEAIRQRRMQQLMGQYGGGGGQVRLSCHRCGC
jgi:hypothetical protein